jgi:hypothetical protein
LAGLLLGVAGVAGAAAGAALAGLAGLALAWRTWLMTFCATAFAGAGFAAAAGWLRGALLLLPLPPAWP